MTPRVFDTRRCSLGEGPLWHPERGQLFWFDILSRRLLTRTDTGPQHWQFDEMISAAGWIDRDRLLVASESQLFTFDLATGAKASLAPLEADRPGTRSNDGRADPQGGFWIGTMGKQAEPGAGAIYRYCGGEVRLLFDALTIPNAICFAPGEGRAYFADTARGRIMTVALDPEGWPKGAAEVFVDFGGAFNPDGAVCDADGNLWNAQWGAGRVAVYAPDGTFLAAHEFSAARTSCPAFGGPELRDLFCTSASENIADDDTNTANGQTFVQRGAGHGQAEHRVILP